MAMIIHDSRVNITSPNIKLFIVFLWNLTLLYQLVRSMQIDAGEITQSRLDLLGYWFCFLLAICVALWKRKSLALKITLSSLALMAYIALTIFFSASSQLLVSTFLSRYGILMWYTIGIGFSFSLYIISDIVPIRTKLTFLLALIFLGLGFTWMYILSNSIDFAYSVTSNYQSVASLATILFALISGILVARWGSKPPLLIFFAAFICMWQLTFSVAFLQSTSIILSASLISAYACAAVLRDANLISRVSVAIALIASVYQVLRSELFELLLYSTRFNLLVDASILQFSSISNRLQILDTFIDQFQVSPIFGSYTAEIVSGAGEGNYIHSIPISFLTHTGVFGTLLFLNVMWNIYRLKTSRRCIDNCISSHLSFLLIIILFIGSISTFLTWPPFWFMVGSCSVLPRCHSFYKSAFL